MDLTNEDDVAELDLKSMDIVVTAMGRNLSASIMPVAVSKEKGVPLIVAKSSSERMTSILIRHRAVIPSCYFNVIVNLPHF